MKKVISVSEQHIDIGFEESADQCPIALAAVEAGLTMPHVYWDECACEQEDCPLSYYELEHGHGEPHERNAITLPKEAAMFVRKFDAGEKVEPFSFEVAL